MNKSQLPEVESQEVEGVEAQEVESKYQGFEPDIKFENNMVVGTVNHVGKHGYLKIEGGVNALPFVYKAIDWVEEKIPGDQKSIAQALKSAVSKIKF